MDRRPKLKLTNEIVSKIINSNRIFYELLKYDISYDDVKKYCNMELNKTHKYLLNKPILNDEAEELVKLYDNVISQRYFYMCEFEKLNTLDQACVFFKNKTGKEYSTDSLVEFYKYQIYEDFRNFWNYCYDLIDSHDNDNLIRDKKLSDDSLENLSGGKGHGIWKRIASAAFLGMNLFSPLDNTVSAMDGMDYMDSGPILSEDVIKRMTAEAPLKNRAPQDYFLLSSESASTPSNNSEVKQPQKSSLIKSAAMSGIVLGGLHLGRKLLDKIGLGVVAEIFQLPKNLSDMKGYHEKLKENLKESQNTMKDFMGKKHPEEAAAVANNPNMLGNKPNTVLTSEIFGQEEALTAVADYCLAPFGRHALMGAREMMNNMNSQQSIFNQQDPSQMPSSRNSLISIVPMFGPPGVGKTETYKVIKDKIFGCAIPNALIQVSSFETAGSKSFQDWLWENKDWKNLVDRTRREGKQFMTLFDEFDKLSDRKRAEICEFLRYVHDNGQFPAMKDQSVVPIDRALIFIATNEVNPRLVQTEDLDATGNPYDRPDQYKEARKWDPSFLSRVTAMIDYKQLTPYSLAEILAGRLRKLRKDYCAQTGINVDVADDFYYWAVSSISDEERLNDGARLVKNRLESLISTEFDRQIHKVEQMIDNAVAMQSVSINREDLVAELTWVTEEYFEKELGRKPRGSISIPGLKDKYAPLIIVKHIKPNTDNAAPVLDWKNKKSICDILADWRLWARLNSVECDVDMTKINTLHDRLVFGITDDFVHNKDPRDKIKSTIDYWIEKTCSTYNEYIIFVQILKDLNLEPTPNPLDRQMALINDEIDNLPVPSVGTRAPVTNTSSVSTEESKENKDDIKNSNSESETTKSKDNTETKLVKDVIEKLNEENNKINNSETQMNSEENKNINSVEEQSNELEETKANNDNTSFSNETEAQMNSEENKDISNPETKENNNINSLEEQLNEAELKTNNEKTSSSNETETKLNSEENENISNPEIKENTNTDNLKNQLNEENNKNINNKISPLNKEGQNIHDGEVSRNPQKEQLVEWNKNAPFEKNIDKHTYKSEGTSTELNTQNTKHSNINIQNQSEPPETLIPWTKNADFIENINKNTYNDNNEYLDTDDDSSNDEDLTERVDSFDEGDWDL